MQYNDDYHVGHISPSFQFFFSTDIIIQYLIDNSPIHLNTYSVKLNILTENSSSDFNIIVAYQKINDYDFLWLWIISYAWLLIFTVSDDKFSYWCQWIAFQPFQHVKYWLIFIALCFYVSPWIPLKYSVYQMYLPTSGFVDTYQRLQQMQ